MVDFLAGFGAIGEVGMPLRIGERQGAGRRGNDADETLADTQARAVHGLAPQSFGGEQLQDLRRPA